MEHLAEQSVLDLVGGVIAGAEAAAIHDHLDRCAECRALVGIVLRAEATPPELAQGSEGATRADAPGALRAALWPPTMISRAPGPGELTELAAQAAPAAMGPAPAQQRQPIERIDEYRVIELLGRGGMGTVYRAHDTLLDREVAIKLMARAESEAARQRFLVEARAVARIRHPNVVAVHRIGIAADQPYIVYDLVRGRTFRELTIPMPWPRVIALAVGALRGLAAAHACSVLHRDLKPANLMLDQNGDVVLVDFGLAKLAGEPDAAGADEREPAGAGAPPEDPRMTATGTALGTPRYMAPEAWRGHDATPATDLYSLGVVLYELIAGRPPFSELGHEALARRVCAEDPPPLAHQAPWVPPLLAALIDRCLARDPAARPPSAAALREEIEALQRGRAFEAFEKDRVRRAPVGNPYPGERPFGFEHQGVFFGRTEELRALIEQLRERPLVVVAGEAGAGKTSLCLAGLLPIVARGALGGPRKWVPVPVVLGARPLAALTDALAQHVELPREEIARLLVEDPAPVLAQFRAGHANGCSAHVLFVDGLDDLLAADPAEARAAAAILGKLAEPAPAVRVLATMRAQNLLAIARLPGLAAVIGPAIYLLLEPCDPGALRDIIVEPARIGGRALDEPTAGELLAAATSGELRLAELGARLATLWDARGAS